jgi:hypothetical protein
MSLEHLSKLSKRDLREHLLSLGLNAYAAARVLLFVFGGHAIPVDRTLAETLEMEEQVHPGSSVEDVQGFLERIISQKDARNVHEFLRAHVERCARALAKFRQAKAEAAAKAEAERAKAEAARVKAEEEARAKAAQAAKAKAAKAKMKAKAQRQKAAARKARKVKAKRPARSYRKSK